VTCPLCKFITKIRVENEPAITFKCNCGQMLQFNVPRE
jgi:hypothetical protein